MRAEGELDPARAHEIWAAGRDELAREHPASPVPPERRVGYAGLRHAPYDPGLRFVLPVDGVAERRRLEVPTATDGVVPFELVGRLHLPLGDLDVWWLDSYGGGVFLPVKDASAGRATYGGGRYVLDTVKGADLGGSVHDAMVVDLNFAYNPSCAYDPAWTCPLAPPGNALEVEVIAGELIPPAHD